MQFPEIPVENIPGASAFLTIIGMILCAVGLLCMAGFMLGAAKLVVSAFRHGSVDGVGEMGWSIVAVVVAGSASTWLGLVAFSNVPEPVWTKIPGFDAFLTLLGVVMAGITLLCLGGIVAGAGWLVVSAWRRGGMEGWKPIVMSMIAAVLVGATSGILSLAAVG